MAAKRNRRRPAVIAPRERRDSTQAEEPCTVRECGRPAYARGMCQTHHRQMLTTGRTRDIRPYRPRVSGTVKYAGLRLTPACVEELEKHRKAHGLSEGAAIAEILEAWNAPRRRRA